MRLPPSLAPKLATRTTPDPLSFTATQLVGTTISLGVFTRALVAAIPLLATTKDRRLDVLRFGDDGFKSIGKLLLGGLLQGYVWAWCAPPLPLPLPSLPLLPL